MHSILVNPQHFNPRILYMMRRFFDAKSESTSHSHDFLSLIYILSGEGRYEIGGEIHTVSSGTLFVCNPEITHHRILSNNQKVEEFQVGITNLNIKGLPPNFLIPGHDAPQFVFHRYGQDFYLCLEEIHREQQKNDEASVLMLKCLVMKLLVYIIKERYIPLQSAEKNVFYLERYDKTTMVDNIVSFINENYMKSVSLAKISENTYLSPIYVSKVFKETVGEAPINYLIRVRLTKSCDLLYNKGLAIKEIARMVGYEDAYYFSKLFKKYFGISPAAYRKAEIKPAFQLHPLNGKDKQSKEY